MGISAQEELERLNRANLLSRLIVDKTSGHNIIWGTDAYAHLGADYARGAEVTVGSLLSPPFQLMSRADKASSEQSQRTRAHAEVFTPLWVVEKMNGYIEEDWFGREAPFSGEKVLFPERKSWQDFVDSRCLEITCGEAPYLVTRYDVTTGESVPIGERVGILDRKMRVVRENTKTEEEWVNWAYRAYKATYGYEFQGDNVLLARLNLLLTFEEYMGESLGRGPTDAEQKKLLNVIAWNLWQMDGLTGKIPYCRTPGEYSQIEVPGLPLGEEEDKQPSCRIFNWHSNRSIEYNTGKW